MGTWKCYSATARSSVPLSAHSSQNHRTAELGRDFWRSSGPATLLRQGHLEQAAQHHVQASLEYLQEWALHNLSRQPAPVLSRPHSKKVFPAVQRDPPAFQFVLTACGSATGNH